MMDALCRVKRGAILAASCCVLAYEIIAVSVDTLIKSQSRQSRLTDNGVLP